VKGVDMSEIDKTILNDFKFKFKPVRGKVGHYEAGFILAKSINYVKVSEINICFLSHSIPTRLLKKYLRTSIPNANKIIYFGPK
jgi:hypothetical protein